MDRQQAAKEHIVTQILPGLPSNVQEVLGAHLFGPQAEALNYADALTTLQLVLVKTREKGILPKHLAWRSLGAAIALLAATDATRLEARARCGFSHRELYWALEGDMLGYHTGGVTGARRFGRCLPCAIGKPGKCGAASAAWFCRRRLALLDTRGLAPEHKAHALATDGVTLLPPRSQGYALARGLNAAGEPQGPSRKSIGPPPSAAEDDRVSLFDRGTWTGQRLGGAVTTEDDKSETFVSQARVLLDSIEDLPPAEQWEEISGACTKRYVGCLKRLAGKDSKKRKLAAGGAEAGPAMTQADLAGTELKRWPDYDFLIGAEETDDCLPKEAVAGSHCFINPMTRGWAAEMQPFAFGMPPWHQRPHSPTSTPKLRSSRADGSPPAARGPCQPPEGGRSWSRSGCRQPAHGRTWQELAAEQLAAANGGGNLAGGEFAAVASAFGSARSAPTSPQVPPAGAKPQPATFPVLPEALSACSAAEDAHRHQGWQPWPPAGPPAESPSMDSPDAAEAAAERFLLDKGMHSSASPAIKADLSDAPSDLTFHPSRGLQRRSVPAMPVSVTAHPLGLPSWEPGAPCSPPASAPLQQPIQRQQQQSVQPATHTKTAQQAYIEQQQHLHEAVQTQWQQQRQETSRRASSLPASTGFQQSGGTAGGLGSPRATQCSGPWPAHALGMQRQLPPQLHGPAAAGMPIEECPAAPAKHPFGRSKRARSGPLPPDVTAAAAAALACNGLAPRARHSTRPPSPGTPPPPPQLQPQHALQQLPSLLLQQHHRSRPAATADHDPHVETVFYGFPHDALAALAAPFDDHPCGAAVSGPAAVACSRASAPGDSAALPARTQPRGDQQHQQQHRAASAPELPTGSWAPPVADRSSIQVAAAAAGLGGWESADWSMAVMEEGCPAFADLIGDLLQPSGSLQPGSLFSQGSLQLCGSILPGSGA